MVTGIMYVSIPHYLKHQFSKGQSRKIVISLLEKKIIIVSRYFGKARFIPIFFAKTLFTLMQILLQCKMAVEKIRKNKNRYMKM